MVPVVRTCAAHQRLSAADVLGAKPPTDATKPTPAGTSATMPATAMPDSAANDCAQAQIHVVLHGVRIWLPPGRLGLSQTIVGNGPLQF